MKISKRIKCIEQHIQDHYQHIWDCCCDHGFLGGLLLETKRAPHIHFVDIVPSIMIQLERQLEQFFPLNTPSGTSWLVHCQDVASIDLQAFKHDAHLVVIAGVGGELTAHLVKHISHAHPEINLEFLLCPVNHSYKLRHTLINARLGLKSEFLIEENQRFYEVIHVSSRSATPISPVGDGLWQSNEAAQHHYLSKLLKHYKKSSQQSSLDNDAYVAYQSLYHQLNNAL
ncbi:tRNA (adenine(22)-N(1))-methyltransferase [Pseudoalteromonas ulvae]|uniref:SAM-dependent methyltransferase n=1 Tax=Pseudoalteromonas ulvae TaxID=107327 RepID=A0A244CT02_PSEDV|nr:tRNA (adenine(22)-N(1))-methyltransferase TrmK [Pseudoalteromonas ulvae]OUL58750.1 hypothetical protein B1199_00210 [Pseudoalteromonas ulvae]